MKQRLEAMSAFSRLIPDFGLRTGGAMALLALLLAIAGTRSSLGDSEKKEAFDPQSLVGQSVTIRLTNDETLRAVEVVSVREDKVRGAIRMVTVVDPRTQRPRPIVAASIASLIPEPGGHSYRLDEESKRLLPDDSALKARLKQELEKSADNRESRRTAKSSSDAKEKNNKDEKDEKAEAAKSKKAKPKDPFDLPLKPGVRRWPELTEEEQKTLVTEKKSMLTKLQEMAQGRRFHLIETKFFLFLSDLPPQDLQLYVPYMDAMYQRLIGMFGIKPGTNIWRGKAVMIIFAHKATFVAYEQQFQAARGSLDGVQALCHCKGNGDVLIVGHTSFSDRIYLAQVLVHETTHGFLWRYKTGQDIPSWANEGLAEFIASVIVPGNHGTQLGGKRAMTDLRKTGRVGHDFFTSRQIASPQYGMALNITSYMVASSPPKYRLFIEGMKSGMSDEESLQNAFNVTREQLLIQYGRTLGIPVLQQ